MSTVNYLISEVTGLPVPFDPLTQTLTFNNLAVAASGVVLEQVGSDTLVTARDSAGITLFTVTLLGVTASSLSGSQFIFEDGSFYKQGTAGNDSLVGGLQSDYLNGLVGRDTMVGGAGDDTYIVDNQSDVTTETDASSEIGGFDTVISSVSRALAANIEKLVLTGTSALNGNGNSLSNILVGNDAANILTGVSGGSNRDTMIGGGGNDTYVLGNAYDDVVEDVDGGIDTVQSSFSITVFADNVENLLLTGSAVNGTGNFGDNKLTGNAVANELFGSAGDDTLDGAAGVDTLIGGVGSDTYINASGDLVEESEGSEFGTHDVMSSSVSYTLNVANVEDVTLTGTSAINATGDINANIITGNSGANILDGGDFVGGAADILKGGVGNDTYIVRNVADVVVETSTISAEKDTVKSYVDGFSLANIDGDELVDKYVENLTLMGTAVSGTGNEIANVITGNELNNILDGAAGVDTLVGGVGNDTYIVDTTTDVITEATGAGTHDLVKSSVSYTLYAANVEDLTLTGVGNVNATGSSVANILIGNEGVNILDGGLGVDSLEGGKGNDTYVVDSVTDIIKELSGTIEGAADLVKSSVSFSLSSSLVTNVENLTLTGSAGVNATGSAIANILTGNSGANKLDGGAGIDTLIGGVGNDTYVVDREEDVIQENGAADKDTVESTASGYTLSANLEILQLKGTDSQNGTGNELANTIVGNDFSNILDGLAGADTLQGGKGGDIYYVDNAADIIIESATDLDDGDSVESTVSYTLATGVESLMLSGAAALNATGNDINNSIEGNSGANIINGGTGVDLLKGGSGSDTYIVDSITDTITESAGTAAGVADLVQSSVSFSLASTLVTNVENLTLVGTALNGTGNNVKNVITGNALANQLDGGVGADTMIGGLGNDVYVVDNTGDVVTEVSTIPTEIDRVESSVAYTLGSYLENLTLTGSANIAGTGNTQDNYIKGNGGKNTLNGGLGVISNGADTLEGGAGADTYIVKSDKDIVIEALSTVVGESDKVQSSVSYSLTANVEELELTGTALSGQGNELANKITGNAGNNIVSSGAQVGGVLVDDGAIDTLTGGAGADTYIVGVGDVIVEDSTVATEIDVIKSAVSFSIVDLANVENITLTGTAAINAEGNAKANVLTGNSAANELNGNGGIDTMIGGAGNDLYYVDSGKDLVTETITVANEIDTVNSSANYTLGANLENLILSGTAKNGAGNALINTITGNDGANTIDGKGGADSLEGGAGADTYLVDNASDIVTEEASSVLGERDLVRSSVNYTLASNSAIEDLTLTGTVGKQATGNHLANYITGNTQANILKGGDDSGAADTLSGGAGADTYYVGLNDVVTELSTSTAEIDNVISDATFVLSANLENLQLTGDSDINGTGNKLGNKLTGNTGNNSLDGGLGADTMTGGAGNDIYSVDSAGDVVVEAGSVGSGTDHVNTTVSWTASANVENVDIDEGTGNVNVTGNGLVNQLSGSDGNNILNGAAGADFMSGGAGNDTYYVDNVGDVVDEFSNGGTGTDTIITSIDYDMEVKAITESSTPGGFVLSGVVENLTLLTGALSGTGNGVANKITGNAGNNILDGGAGIDTLVGYAGNDIYYVDVSGDVIQETTTVSSESDVVHSTAASYTLSVNLEELWLDTGALNGTGNTQNNSLYGNAANNKLDGNAGADTMSGGAGNDTYIVDNVNDVISDTSGVDTVQTAISYTLSDVSLVEKLVLTGVGAVNGTGNNLANTLTGNSGKNVLSGLLGDDTLNGGDGNDSLLGGEGNDVLKGELGIDSLTGGAGNDDFILTSSANADVIADFAKGFDKLVISQAGIAIGDGDLTRDAASVRASAGGFSSTNELVIFTANISGSITTEKAVVAIGSSINAIATGQTRLFAVDNGVNTNVYLFTSSDGNAAISAGELKLLVTMNGVDNSTTGDYQFQA